MDEDGGKYDYELVRFVFDLRTEDPLRMLVRAQAHIEQSLRQFILANAPFPRHAALEQLDFDGTARLAFVLGLAGYLKSALKALGALQTKFVRSVDAKFGSQEADNFYNALSPILKEILRDVYKDFRAKQNLGEFKRQAPTTRLVWYLIGIWSGILADRQHGPIPYHDGFQLPASYFEDIEERRADFIALLDGSDDFQLVIRGHSYLDRELREFVSAAARQPDAIRSADYDYAGTLRLALTLGLDASLEAGLSAIGALRNKFAHRLDLELTRDEAMPIFDRLDPDSQADAMKSWTTTYQELPGMGRPKNLLDARPRDLVATSMAMLYMAILLEVLRRRPGSLEDRRESE